MNKLKLSNFYFNLISLNHAIINWRYKLPLLGDLFPPPQKQQQQQQQQQTTTCFAPLKLL